MKRKKTHCDHHFLGMVNGNVCKAVVLLLLFLAFHQGTSAQNITVSGVVTDESGVAIIGASVIVKGTSTGTITDFDGQYFISAPTGGILKFSYIGYTDQEYPINSRTTINVSMKEDAVGLEEVVVVGYGTVKKRDLTGAVASVSSEQLKGRSYSNAMQSLAGQMPGVQILQVSGAPGFAPSIKVRGSSSVNSGTNPLYVIDGVPLDDPSSSSGQDAGDSFTANRNPMNFINPNDIESIEVLKDASSSAIYGSRGANGIVLITTKQGKAGKTRVEANYEYGISSVQRRVDVMNAPEWLAYEKTARQNSGAEFPAVLSDSYWLNKIGNGTDWQDVLFRTGATHNVQLSVSGGSENTQFMISGNYLGSEGVVDQNTYQRFTVRSNLRHKISDKVNIGLNASLARVSSDDIGTGGKADVVSLALQSTPALPVYTERGTLGPLDPNSEWHALDKALSPSLWHPYSTTREQERNRLTYNSQIAAFLEWKILDGLAFKTSLSATYNGVRYQSFWNSVRNYGYPGGDTQPAEGKYKTNQSFNWVTENTLNYNKTFGDHSVTGLLGYTVQENKYEDSNILSGSFPNNGVHTLNAGKPQTAETTASEWALISYLARATYSYQGKYLASASIRTDGSSRFGINSRWGYFPSASIGWRMSEEDFMKNIDWLNNLKLRASYGVTGNNQIGDYGAIGLLDYDSYALGGKVIQGIYTKSFPDKDLRWERTSQVNVGLDASFFNQRLNLAIDYYHSVTNDLLLAVPIPAITGFTSTLTNIGKLQNKGLEVSLTSVNIKGAFEWSTNFNISGNRNKILALGNNDAPFNVVDFDANVRFEVGKPMAYFYGYQIDGVIMSTADLSKYPVWSGSEAGDPKVADTNHDGKIDSDDRTMIGSSQPDFIWSMTNNFNYKGFDLSIMLSGSEGNEIFNQNARYLKRYNGARGVYGSVANYWKSESDPGDGQIPKPRSVANTVQNLATSYWVEDGSFVRIKNIRLGYTLPKKATQKLGLSATKIYVNFENVYVFSDYSNYDPEASTYTTGALVGLDFGSYPNPFVCTMGINLNF
ncbi:TonB-dependent receptor SusC [termite gut metagenome]|uniref:TonB-dependent receptor SusC n=1 Tax=termite gut metagenome TaxID=433724 RepID=A0A5J4SQ53_9ZZZZ